MYFLFNFAWYSIQLDIVCWFLLNRQNLLTKSVKLDKSYLLRIPNKVGVCMSQWKTENWSQESFLVNEVLKSCEKQYLLMLELM